MPGFLVSSFQNLIDFTSKYNDVIIDNGYENGYYFYRSTSS